MFGWREIEGGKKSGGKCFPWGPPFFFPLKLEGNEKQERIAHVAP